MSDRTKQILLIIAFILITILIAVAIYYVFFRPVFFPPAPAPVTPTPTPTLPPISLINITPPPAIINALPGLTNEIPSVPAAGITPGPEISYVATGGLTAFQTLEANQTQNLNLATNGQNINYYDTVSGSFYTITPDGQKQLLSDISFRNVSDVTWSPNSQKVVLEYPDGSNTIFNFATKKNITLPSQWADFSFSNDSQQIVFKDLRVDPDN